MHFSVVLFILFSEAVFGLGFQRIVSYRHEQGTEKDVEEKQCTYKRGSLTIKESFKNLYSCKSKVINKNYPDHHSSYTSTFLFRRSRGEAYV